MCELLHTKRKHKKFSRFNFPIYNDNAKYNHNFATKSSWTLSQTDVFGESVLLTILSICGGDGFRCLFEYLVLLLWSKQWIVSTHTILLHPKCQCENWKKFLYIFYNRITRNIKHIWNNCVWNSFKAPVVKCEIWCFWRRL